MLKFIIGTNEEARRALLYADIAAAKRAVLIVPEQFSFESEKLLQEKLGAAAAQKVEVLSFSRLANSIFRAYGGLAGEYCDPTAKLLLMGAALATCGDDLCYYRKNTHGAAFIEKLVAAENELKNAGVEANQLLSLAENGGALGEKAQDLSRVFALYNALLEKSYVDPLTDIKRAAELLSANNFFGEITVFLDSFTGFTGSEYLLISQILAQAPELEISLCCDSLYDTTSGTGLFSKTQRTAGRLIRAAREAGQSVAPAVFAEAKTESRPNAIADLEENFLQNREPSRENKGEVTLVTAADPYSEATFVAAEARRLAEKEGYRWREIAVIARDLTPYEHALPAAFKRAGAPLYMDQTASLAAHPLSAFIGAALAAVRGNFPAAEVLRLLKTGLFPVSEEEIAEFENYCFVWNIRGGLFLAPFTGSPAGFRELTPEDGEALARLNALREKVIAPLDKLKRRLANADGREFAAAFYDFLCECEVTEGLLRLYNELSAAGEIAAAENLDAFWSFTVAALDKFSAALGGVVLQKDEAGRLFELIINSAEIGVLPKTLDCVSAGTADRFRPSGAKAVFVLGLTEGAFPAPPKSSSLFTANERKAMAEAGIDLGEGEDDEVLAERMYAYTAFTCASERVYALFPRYDLSSEEQTKSVLISRLKEAVKPLFETEVSKLPEDFWLCSESFGFERLCAKGEKPGGAREALRQYFLEQQEWKTRAQNLGSYMKAEDFALETRETAAKIFGENYRFSPSKLDTFGRCPFSYFIKSGLRLRERQKAELSPLSSGTLIHYVLQVLIPKFGGKGLAALSEEELRKEVDAVLKDYLDTVMDTEKGKTARFMYLYRRTAGFLVKLLRRLGEEFEHSEFEPYAFEEPLGGDEVAYYTLQTPDGKKITVEGTIDRVDVLKRDGEKYVRVVDYKTGTKDFALSDVYYGINIQMLVYLFSIWQGGKQGLANATPSGVLYLPAKNANASADRNLSTEEIAEEQKKKFKMNGLLLNDESVLNAMEPGLEGIYIPAKKDKAGVFGSLATLEEFGKIKEHIDNLLCDIAGELAGGKIGALPYRKGSETPCEVCPYKGICRRNEHAPFNEHESFKDSEFYQRIKEGKPNGGENLE